MNFDFSDEQRELRDQVRRFLAQHASPRSAIAAGGHDPALWRGMAELGLLGIAIPEAYGGAGAGYLELCVVAEEVGRALAPVPFSSSACLAAEFILQAGSEAQKRAWLPRLADGTAIAVFAAVEGIGDAAPDRIAATVSGGRLTGIKSPVLDGGVADLGIVAARGADGIGLYLVDLRGAGVARSGLDSVDPTRSLVEIRFEGAPAERLGEAGWDTVERMLDRAAVPLAFEQVGGADRALEMARDYALERIAFGRPIGSFQAVKHMLADMYVSATLARSNAYWAAWALATDAAELGQAAASARVSATEAFSHCARNNIQVHGGMGFTWEFDCHLFYRRAALLATALGGPALWEDRLVAQLRAA